MLLLDDTWTGGGHAQSAVLGLRAAGATRVSLLVVARWIKKEFGNNAEFLRELASGSGLQPRDLPMDGRELSVNRQTAAAADPSVRRGR